MENQTDLQLLEKLDDVKSFMIDGIHRGGTVFKVVK